MNEIVEEWVRKAEADFATASRECEVLDAPNYDAVCFHAQQCAEKLLKALIMQAGGRPPKTHDLVQLHLVVQPLVPGWSWPLDELRYVTSAALQFRYPGESAGREDAQTALEICRHIRDAVKVLI